MHENVADGYVVPMYQMTKIPNGAKLIILDPLLVPEALRNYRSVHQVENMTPPSSLITYFFGEMPQNQYSHIAPAQKMPLLMYMCESI